MAMGNDLPIAVFNFYPIESTTIIDRSLLKQ